MARKIEHKANEAVLNMTLIKRETKMNTITNKKK